MIVKTRQKSGAEIEEWSDAEAGKARGVLRRQPEAGKLRHARRSPGAEMGRWIAHYWMVSWDLRGAEPHVVESLPHPNVHVVFEKGHSVVSGVYTEKFSRVLKGAGQVFGVKFRPGGIRPFLDGPVSELANRMIPARRVLGKEVEELEKVLLSRRTEEEKVEAANAFFRERMPEEDEGMELAGRLVERILKESDIKTVEDLARRAGMGKRTVQRIFQEYVGVSPKWVIRRYRLHELLERCHSGEGLDWAEVALELGYFDQAHLINDFRTMVGYSPTQYRKQAVEGAGS